MQAWGDGAVLRRCGGSPWVADHPPPEAGDDGCAGGAGLAPPTAHPTPHPLTGGCAVCAVRRWGARTPRMRAMRGSMRGSRMHRSRRLPVGVIVCPLPRLRRLRHHRRGRRVTSSGPGRWLPRSRRPARPPRARRGRVWMVRGLSGWPAWARRSPSCLTVWRSPPARRAARTHWRDLDRAAAAGSRSWSSSSASTSTGVGQG